MKVFLTHPPTANDLPWEGRAFVRSIRTLLEQSPDKRGHELADSPAEADVILYLEPQLFRDRSYAELLLREENVRQFPEKCFAYGYADAFVGFLPGLYVCLPLAQTANPRFASWNYILGLPNPLIEKLAEERNARTPHLLFSFRGSNSAPVRVPIFAHANAWKAFACISKLDGKSFHNATTADQRLYGEQILDSQFGLCPRGLGCSSHRLFETMALGRVPVILSDAWVEPNGPAWEECSVRVAEKDAGNLPDILRSYESNSAEMGRKARTEWDTWFAPPVAIPRFLDRLERLVAEQKEIPDYERLWRSWSFYVPYGLAPHQKLWRNLRSGQGLGKVLRKASVGRGVSSCLKH